MFTEVTYADYIGDYKVSVLFNDGVKKTIDFYSLLFEHDYPAFRPLKNIEVFETLKLQIRLNGKMVILILPLKQFTNWAK